MKKTYCDNCGNEVTSKNEGQYLVADIGNLHASSTTRNKDASDDIDICKYCVIGAFERLDDRPKTS